MYRSSMKEAVLFAGRTIAKRSSNAAPLQRVEQGEYIVYSCLRNGLCGIAFVESSYPMRAAFSIIREVLNQYEREFGRSWEKFEADKHEPWPFLEAALKKYQDPAEADKLLKIQQDLDDTKVILHKTIQSVLERGEKLDTLAEKSTDLSNHTRMFLKRAKQTNQCCNIA